MATDIAGIILAGTHPWTNSAFDALPPRALLPIAHRPLISNALYWLHREGIRDVAVCGNRETRILQSRLARLIPEELNLSYHEDPMPRGAAGSARDAAMATRAHTLIIAEGTAIPNVDLGDLLARHQDSGACVTVVVHAESRRTSSSPLHVPNGIYVFERRALEEVPTQGFCDIKETLIPNLHASGERIVPYQAPAATPRVLDSSTYMAVHEWMVELEASSDHRPDGYVRTAQGLVHRSATIADDASLIGPVLIAPEARVLPGAVIVGPTSVGRQAVVESGAMVSRSAIWRRSVVGESAIVDGSIVADDALVDAGHRLTCGVALADGRTEDSRRSVVRLRSSFASRRAGLDLRTRLARLASGAAWSRSPAAQ